MTMGSASNASPGEATTATGVRILDAGEWAIYCEPAGGWLVDTCAMGAWSWDVYEALSMGKRSMQETALMFSEDSGIPLQELRLIRIR